MVIREDSPFTQHWRVMDLYPGKDGNVRVVQVKAASSIYQRPVAKLALILPESTSPAGTVEGHSPFGGECVPAPDAGPKKQASVQEEDASKT